MVKILIPAKQYLLVRFKNLLIIKSITLNENCYKKKKAFNSKNKSDCFYFRIINALSVKV
jgi:hypothetical protein